MTRDMWVQVAILGTCLVATVVIGYIVWSDVWPEEKTVEQEQDEVRAPFVLVGQHHPSEPEEYESLDDPIYMMVHEIQPRKEA